MTGGHEKLLALPELMCSGRGSATDVGGAFTGVRKGPGYTASKLALMSAVAEQATCGRNNLRQLIVTHGPISLHAILKRGRPISYCLTALPLKARIPFIVIHTYEQASLIDSIVRHCILSNH